MTGTCPLSHVKGLEHTLDFLEVLYVTFAFVEGVQQLITDSIGWQGSVPQRLQALLNLLVAELAFLCHTLIALEHSTYRDYRYNRHQPKRHGKSVNHAYPCLRL